MSVPSDPVLPTLDGAREEAERLRAELRRHDYLYHVEDRPEISDDAYDRLFERLKSLEEAYPELRAPDSPTGRVGAEPREGFRAVRHLAPMLSLDSTREPADVARFDERVRRALGAGVEPTYLIEPKLDGASIELVYEEGVLARAVTRGDGRTGEDVTENLRTVPTVPLRLRDEERPAPGVAAFRGEVIMYISDFETYNRRLVEAGREAYASPRNSAAGAIRQLDPRLTAERRLDVLVYDVLALEGVAFETDAEGVEAIRRWGFKVPPGVRTATSVDEILAYHTGFRDERDALDYEIDGVVIKLDDLAAREAMGATSHHPRWALAVKFEPRKEVTRIEAIGVQVGRTGTLTPVAFLRPVVVGGVTVSRASLHNREELRRKDIREGDTVRVQRAGDVIPQVVEVIGHAAERRRPFEMPERCPACGAELREDGPRTVCPNRFGCPAQLKGRLVHFGSRNALDIEGLGSETAALLVERGLVRELADLFTLEPGPLAELDGFAEKSATKLVEAIRARRRPELARFLVALGIPEVGVAVARDLARHFGSFDALRRAGREELEAMRGVGPRMSEAIRAFFDEERNAMSIDRVLERGVEPEARPAATRAGEAAGEGAPGVAVFTGTLPVPRVTARAAWEGVGGRAAGSVSGRTAFVVAGEDAGSKLERARELGVPVLDWDAFVTRLEALGGSVEGTG